MTGIVKKKQEEISRGMGDRGNTVHLDVLFFALSFSQIW